MFLKSFKTPFAAAALLAAVTVSVPTTTYAQPPFTYCGCVADCFNGGTPDPVGCMDWCAGVYQVQYCEGATVSIAKDRR